MSENRIGPYTPPADIQPNEVRLQEITLAQMEQYGSTKNEIDSLIDKYVIGQSFLQLAGIPTILTDFASSHFPGIPKDSFEAVPNFQFFRVETPQGKRIFVMAMFDVLFSADNYGTRVSAGLIDDTHIWGFYIQKRNIIVEDSAVINHTMEHAKKLSIPLRDGYIPERASVEEARFLASNDIHSMYDSAPKHEISKEIWNA